MSERRIDEALVAQCHKGDKEAFDVLTLKYQARIKALVMPFLADKSEAQDVTQDVFEKAYKGLMSFRGDASFYTWLYRIAVNTAKNYHHSQSKHNTANDIDFLEAEQYLSDEHLKELEGPEGVFLRGQVQLALLDAMAALPEDMYLALMLRDFAGFSYREISDIFECPKGTACSRIYRARAMIDASVQPLVSDPLIIRKH